MKGFDVPLRWGGDPGLLGHRPPAPLCPLSFLRCFGRAARCAAEPRWKLRPGSEIRKHEM